MNSLALGVLVVPVLSLPVLAAIMNPDEQSSGLAATNAASEFIKYTIAVAAGVLVFSVDLITKDIEISRWAKWLLALSWGALAISIGAGIFAFSRIPIKLAEKNYDLDDAYFYIPGRLHQMSFVIGVGLLGLGMIIILSRKTE